MKTDQFILEHWAEALAVIILMLGFFFAIVIESPFIHYVIILLAGLLGGRVVYERHRYQPIFPFILMLIGFLLGFMLGAISANKKVIMFLFLVGFFFSLWLHKQGHMGFFKSEGWIK